MKKDLSEVELYLKTVYVDEKTQSTWFPKTKRESRAWKRLVRQTKNQYEQINKRRSL